MEIFFSHSQNEQDEDVNAFFEALCEGMDANLKFVSRASSRNPLDDAKRLIESSKFLVAVAVKRDEIVTGDEKEKKWKMPDSVLQEITYANGLEKEIVLFCERDVVMAGFTDKMCTYSIFERDNLYRPEILKQIIAPIFNKICEINDTPREEISNKYEYESLIASVKLENVKGDEYIWKYEISKGITFNSAFTSDDECIPSNMWACVPVKEVPEEKLSYEYRVENKRPTNCEIDVSKISESFNSVRYDIKPTAPSDGGYFEYLCAGSSKYFNPIKKSDIQGNLSARQYGGKTYLCADGMTVSAKTKNLKLIFEFPKAYGLTVEDFLPFVSHQDVGISNVNKKEVARFLKGKKTESLSSCFRISFEIKNPKPFLTYGLLWNPPN